MSPFRKYGPKAIQGKWWTQRALSAAECLPVWPKSPPFLHHPPCCSFIAATQTFSLHLRSKNVQLFTVMGENIPLVWEEAAFQNMWMLKLNKTWWEETYLFFFMNWLHYNEWWHYFLADSALVGFTLCIHPLCSAIHLTTPICRVFIRLHVHVDTLTLRYTKLLHLHSCRSSHHPKALHVLPPAAEQKQAWLILHVM